MEDAVRARESAAGVSNHRDECIRRRRHSAKSVRGVDPSVEPGLHSPGGALRLRRRIRDAEMNPAPGESGSLPQFGPEPGGRGHGFGHAPRHRRQALVGGPRGEREHAEQSRHAASAVGGNDRGLSPGEGHDGRRVEAPARLRGKVVRPDVEHGNEVALP